MCAYRAVISVACAASVAAGAVHAQSAPGLRDTLDPADLSWSIMSLTGERRTLESFRGRVIIINSWATWCEPCVAELKSLAALRAAVPDSGLVFALVAAQRQQPVADFVRRRSLRLPVYLELSMAPAVYRFEAVPTTWIVDRLGRIAFRRRGAMAWDTPQVRALVTTLLRQPGPPK